MLTIKVLGSGCPNCQSLEAAARRAAACLGVEAEFVKVTDRAEILRYPLLATPGLVVNEKLVSAGRIPSDGEITRWLADALMAA